MFWSAFTSGSTIVLFASEDEVWVRDDMKKRNDFRLESSREGRLFEKTNSSDHCEHCTDFLQVESFPFFAYQPLSWRPRAGAAAQKIQKARDVLFTFHWNQWRTRKLHSSMRVLEYDADYCLIAAEPANSKTASDLEWSKSSLHVIRCKMLAIDSSLSMNWAQHWKVNQHSDWES